MLHFRCLYNRPDSSEQIEGSRLCLAANSKHHVYQMSSLNRSHAVVCVPLSRAGLTE